MGVLGNQDNMDVPFVMTSYTSQLIEDQQAEDVGDVLLNDPSVRQSYGFGNQSQVFVIRGLPLNSDDISYNGLYGVLPRQILSTDAIERVEVFKGPNAFINGVSPTGSGLGAASTCSPNARTMFRLVAIPRTSAPMAALASIWISDSDSARITALAPG